MPSLYSLPGYFQVTVISFWIPTLVSILCLYIDSQNEKLKKTWVIKGGTVFVALTVLLQIGGWVFDALWMHTVSQYAGLVGSVVCGIWTIAYLFGFGKEHGT